MKNKAAHTNMGVDTEGIKHVLNIQVQTTEGATFWGGVCSELAAGGIKDVLTRYCDGLVRLPEATAAASPLATVEMYVVHPVKAAMRFVGYQDR